MLTPFAPVIRGHKCLFGATSLKMKCLFGATSLKMKCLFGATSLQNPPLPHPKWAQSVAPSVLGGRLKPLFPPRTEGAAACTHLPCALPPRGGFPDNREKIKCLFGATSLKIKCLFGATSLKIKCLFGATSLQNPPLPHPKWAQSVAPSVLGGRLKPLFPPRTEGAAACTHLPCALPPRGGFPKSI